MQRLPPLHQVPVFQRGGTIVPRQMRLRRASSLMGSDPYTLIVAPNASGAAEGTLYLDPGDGYGYRKGEHHYMAYAYAAGTLSVSRLSGGAFNAVNELERVELLSVAPPSKVTLKQPSGDSDLSFHFSAETKRLVIRKPAVLMAATDWSIALS